MFHKSLPEAQAGDQLGALLRGVKKDQLRRGMVLCAPDSVKSHTTFKAQVRVREREGEREGGREGGKKERKGNRQK